MVRSLRILAAPLAVCGLALWCAGCCCQPPPPRNPADIGSGCRVGADSVQVLVQFSPAGQGCRPEATPASVCVKPGGMIHFRFENACDTRQARKPQITQPRLKRAIPPASVASKRKTQSEAILLDCDKSIELTLSPRDHVCKVSEDAAEGYYKYDVKGEGIETLDPDIEVRGGGTD